MKILKIGDKITTKENKEGYYSNYGGNPQITFKPGNIGTIINPKVPKVRPSPGGPYFILIEFKQYNKLQKIGLSQKEIRRI